MLSAWIHFAKSVAVTAPSMRGAMRSKSRVISNRIRIAISGACVVAARTEPIPISAKSPGAMPEPGGSRAASAVPNAPPSAAPTKRGGVNTPPPTPEPAVIPVASAFAGRRSATKASGSEPERIRLTPSYPLPHTSGRRIPIAPTRRPPSRRMPHDGRRVRRRRSSQAVSRRRKPQPASAASRPRRKIGSASQGLAVANAGTV